MPLNEKGSSMINPGCAAIDLLLRWQAHEAGGLAASNTLLAVFGVASPFGRFADKFIYNNPPYLIWLLDIAYDYGVELPPRHGRTPEDPISPSAAAAAIIEHGLRRSRGRRITMPQVTLAALCEYYREKAALLETIKGTVTRQRRGLVDRHLRACQTLLNRLQSFC